MTPRTVRAIRLSTAAAAVAAVLVAPLLALAYFAIPGGSKYAAGVDWWAGPARTLFDPLLTWASAERVYASGVQIFALIFVVSFVGALTVWSSRRPVRGLERLGWRITLTGYTLSVLGAIVIGPALIPDPGGNGSVVDIAYLTMLLPGMLISSAGATVLGIALLRAKFVPRAAAWCLSFALPSVIVLPTVLGHNSLGDAINVVAWGLACRSLEIKAADGILATDDRTQVA